MSAAETNALQDIADADRRLAEMLMNLCGSGNAPVRVITWNNDIRHDKPKATQVDVYIQAEVMACRKAREMFLAGLVQGR